MIRSIAAVVVGYVMAAFIVAVWTTLGIVVLLPPAQPGSLPQPTTAYLVGDILVAILAAIAGGMVVVAIARRAPMIHGAVLAFLMFVVSIGSTVAMGGALPGQPAWYPIAIAIIGPLGVLAGAWFRKNRTGAAPVS